MSIVPKMQFCRFARLATVSLALIAPVASASICSAEPVTGSRDLLSRHTLNEAPLTDALDALVDGKAVEGDETNTLMALMFRFRAFRRTDLHKWAHTDFDPIIVKDGSKDHRGELYWLGGRVTKVTVVKLDARVAYAYGFPEGLPEYYRCQFLINDDQPAIILAMDVPNAWRKGGKFDARAGAYGMLIKTVPREEGTVPLFIAQRVASFPNTLLGNLGMDVGQLDNIRNNEDILDQEREGFYQMLAAVGKAEPGQLHDGAQVSLKKLKTDSYPVEPLFNRPEDQIGKLVELHGTARRVTCIAVDDPDIQARFGIDHFYQIEMFTSDSQSNPIIFAVRELPEGMPLSEDLKYREEVRIAGFFFKKWGYPVPIPESEIEEARAEQMKLPPQERNLKDLPTVKTQLAPYLIGREVKWYPYEPPKQNVIAAAIAGGLFVVAILGVWIALWRYGKADKKFHDDTLSKTYSLDSGVSLNEIGLESETEPDFAKMAEMDQSGKTAEGEEKES